jgi:hypothetical protein
VFESSMNQPSVSYGPIEPMSDDAAPF